MVRNHGVDPRVAQEGLHAPLLPGARAPGVLVEEVPARRELEAVDLHSEPEEHLPLDESPPQLLLGHLGVLEVDRERTVIGALRATDDQVGLVPEDALADALAVFRPEDVIGNAVLVLLPGTSAMPGTRRRIRFSSSVTRGGL